eukprot:4963933-Amphidinium_carterae.1
MVAIAQYAIVPQSNVVTMSQGTHVLHLRCSETAVDNLGCLDKKAMKWSVGGNPPITQHEHPNHGWDKRSRGNGHVLCWCVMHSSIPLRHASQTAKDSKSSFLFNTKLNSDPETRSVRIISKIRKTCRKLLNTLLGRALFWFAVLAFELCRYRSKTSPTKRAAASC